MFQPDSSSATVHHPRGGGRAEPGAVVPPAPRRVRLRRLARRVRRTLWNDKVAATHTVFYLVAAALFLPVVGGLFLFLEDTADGAEKPSAGLRSRAVQGLNQITQSPGVGELAGTRTAQWETVLGPAGSLLEMGIRHEELNVLSYPKVDNLQRGGLIEDPSDDFANYPEFKDALNLGTKYDLHVRLYPVVHTVTGDKYGTTPIRGAHVAYVANMTEYGVDLATGEWSKLTQTAKDEIAALRDLGLDPNPATPLGGFDGKAYHPAHQGLPATTYSYPLGVKSGDVIGDTEQVYVEELVVPPVPGKPYYEWFVTDYLWSAPGVPRYDVVVFGSDVHLERWDVALVKQQLSDYLEAGGSIVFLGTKDLTPGLVNGCDVDPDCLLSALGTGQPVATPDHTNQMLSVPNALRWSGPSGYGRSGSPWQVCNFDDPATPLVVEGINERAGWIPVEITTPIVEPCLDTWFGATSADRYGVTGGALIVNAWDMPTGDEMRKFLANILSYAVMRSAYLDYGPAIPVDQSIESAERLMLVQLPAGGFLDVKIVFYLWRNDCTALSADDILAGLPRGIHC